MKIHILTGLIEINIVILIVERTVNATTKAQGIISVNNIRVRDTNADKVVYNGVRTPGLTSYKDCCFGVIVPR